VAAADRYHREAEAMKDPEDLPGREALKPGHFQRDSPRRSG
jgi:hypothetical protein